MNKTDARSQILEKAKKVSHLSNLNMDPTLSGTIKILIEGEGKKTIGLPGKSDISLNGLGFCFFKLFDSFQNMLTKKFTLFKEYKKIMVSLLIKEANLLSKDLVMQKFLKVAQP